MADVREYLTDREDLFRALADRIWHTPEIGLQEHESSRMLKEFLARNGFSLAPVDGLPTAFVATFGQGSPVIALLGEYDALPGLSQAAGVAEIRPTTQGGPGHGCGHNLLGTAAAAAAMAVKDAIAHGRAPGTIRFYGCPAEETLVGKVFMARQGLFADVDCALTWHPGSVNAVWAASTQAMNSVKVRFHGTAAHAAANPEDGRSALDAVELMDVGANFLREHVPSSTRIHYVITDGGDAPNVVPAHAEVWYYVRAPRRDEVETIHRRLVDVAHGAALMAGVGYEVQLVTGCYDTLPNRTLGDLLQERMEAIGAPRYSPAEHRLAQQLQATFPEGTAQRAVRHLRSRGLELPDACDLVEAVAPSHGYGEYDSGSTDVGDVSHLVPTAQLTAVTAPLGTPGHSWQNVAAAGSAIGHRGMLYAAQVLAEASLELCTRPELVARAQQEFAAHAQPYVSPVRDVPAPPVG